MNSKQLRKSEREVRAFSESCPPLEQGFPSSTGWAGAPRANKKLFFFTFGQRYKRTAHPQGGHPDGWFTIEAGSWDEARAAMVGLCGTSWANCYDETNPPDLKTFPRGELRRIAA
jgi:hypothetical protein